MVQSPADAETDRFHAVSAEPVQVPKDDAEDDVTEQDSIESDADDTITADVEDAEDATVAKERRDAPVVEEKEEAAAAEVDVDGVDA